MGVPENLQPESSIEITPSPEAVATFNVKVVEVPGNHGFCGGIRMTDQVHRMLLRPGIPVRANHPPSHNEIHVASLEAAGLEVVGSDSRVLRPGEVYTISAHGAPEQVKQDAENAGIEVVDTTCPFVRFVELAVEKDKEAGRITVLGGQRGHQEAIDYQSRNPDGFVIVENADDARIYAEERRKSGDTRTVVFRQQTTHSALVQDEIEAVLREEIPDIIIPRRRDTCQAVRFRQESIIALLSGLDEDEKRRRLLLIVGGKKSHNSHAMAEIGEANGVTSRVINSVEDLIEQEGNVFTEEKDHVILSSGASTPEEALEAILDWFKARGVDVRILKKLFAEPDDLVFKFPSEQISKVFKNRTLPPPQEVQ